MFHFPHDSIPIELSDKNQFNMQKHFQIKRHIQNDFKSIEAPSKPK